MSDLIVLSFKDKHEAYEVRLELSKMQVEHLIALEDAVVVIKNAKGKVRLNQAVNLPIADAVEGSFWGFLIGLLFLSPLLGLVVGTAIGALSGVLSDIGIDDELKRKLGESLQPGSSALFLLVREVTSDKVLERLANHLQNASVLKTSLSKDDEASFEAAFEKAKASVYA